MLLIQSVCIAMLIAAASAHQARAQSQALLDRAREEACNLKPPVGEIVSAIQHEEGSGSADLIKENTRRWWPAYNRFARSRAAARLRAHADRLDRQRPAPERYDEIACKNLKPLLAIAEVAARISDAGGKLQAGRVLTRCSRKLCVPESVDRISTRCDYQPLAMPRQPVC